MESQDTVDLQTVGDRASDRNPKREQERPPVGKSLGLSVVNTTKADSHFVFICWLIMMKNERGNRREGPGMRRNAEHLLSGDRLWVELGWTQVPLLSNIKFQLFHRWGRLLGPIWCFMCGHKRVQASFILFSRRLSTPPLCGFTWKAAVEMPTFCYLFLLISLMCVCHTSGIFHEYVRVCVCSLTNAIQPS